MTTQSETPRTDKFANKLGCVNFPQEAIDHARQLEREVTALTAQLAEARTIAWDWGQGVDDAEAAIRKLSRMFPIDAMKEPK